MSDKPLLPNGYTTCIQGSCLKCALTNPILFQECSHTKLTIISIGE
jgi:hypothetical protein